MEPKEWNNLVKAVFTLRGNRCQRCGSETDLLVYQYRWAPTGDTPAEELAETHAGLVNRVAREIELVPTDGETDDD